MEEDKGCTFLYNEVLDATECYDPGKLIRQKEQQAKLFRKLTTQGRLESIVKFGLALITFSSPPSSLPPGESQNLQPGEWVEVRSKEEIFATLDEKKKYRGLLFMPEMVKFCGKRFKVFKKVEHIMLETTGEIRTLKTPTVFLEGVYCDGEFHLGCDRACFSFWKEVWLKRVPEEKS
jgi:hypothetical protein